MSEGAPLSKSAAKKLAAKQAKEAKKAETQARSVRFYTPLLNDSLTTFTIGCGVPYPKLPFLSQMPTL